MKSEEVKSKIDRLLSKPVDFGGDGGDRTLDLLNAIQALSQLSYAPEDLVNISYITTKIKKNFIFLKKQLDFRKK